MASVEPMPPRALLFVMRIAVRRLWRRNQSSERCFGDHSERFSMARVCLAEASDFESALDNRPSEAPRSASYGKRASTRLRRFIESARNASRRQFS